MVDAFAVTNPGARFHDSYIFDIIAEHAEAVLSGQLRRVVITQPPNTLKSLTWCVDFPAWVWVRYPQVRFLIATNDGKNAMRDAVYSRNLLNSSWYQTGFAPDWRLLDDQDSKLFYQNSASGHRVSLSVGGSAAGKKGHILILDDVHDPATIHSKAAREGEKNWFRTGFYDRQMSFKTSAVVVLGHRLPDDLSGELIADGWPELRLPERMEDRLRKTFPVAVPGIGRTDPRKEGEYLQPPMFGEAEEDDVRKVSGEEMWSAKHQQSPERRAGLMFDPDLVTTIAAVPAGTVCLRYWDTAASTSETSCLSAGVLIGRSPTGRTVVIHAKYGRWNPAVRNQIMRAHGFSDATIPGVRYKRMYFEKGISDSGVERDADLIKYLAPLVVTADPAKGDKITRAEPLSAQWAARNVDIVQGDWNREYLAYMAGFPSGRKDVTDASSGGYNRLSEQAESDLPETAPAGETEYENLPKGTFDDRPYSDPYA